MTSQHEETNPYEPPATLSGPSSSSPQPTHSAQQRTRGSRFEVLPSRCPECGQRFRVMLPIARMQKKVALVLYLGAVLTIAWVAAIAALFSYLKVAFIPLSIPGLLLIGLIMVAPLLVAYRWTRRIPRVKTLNCDRCKWSKSWFVEP